MTNFRKTALALASAFMMAGAAGAAGLPDILERDAAGTSAAQKAGAELARLVDGKDDAEAARRMEEREARLLAHYRDKLAASLSRLEASEAAIEAERESVRRMRMETGPLMDEMAASAGFFTQRSPRTGAELASRPRTAGASSPKRMPPCSPKP